MINTDADTAEKYYVLKKLGQGMFGEVHEAKNVYDGTTVALKYVRLRGGGDSVPSVAFREMRALQEMDHPNIIKLLEVFPQGSSLVFVFERMHCDLAEVLRSCRAPLREAHVKAVMLMLLKGLDHLHRNGIMHRDIKPANLLLGADGRLVLADFGQARVFAGDDTNKQKTDLGRGAASVNGRCFTHQVATRWYRAPELLFGSRCYGSGVDMWAAGCIFGELLGLSPLFPGENDIDQIYRVVQQLGTPDECSWPGVNALPDFGKISFPSLPPRPLHLLIPDASESALLLLRRLLTYDPARRITAREALAHPFFFNDPLPAAVADLPLPDIRLASSSSPTSEDSSVSPRLDQLGFLSQFEAPLSPSCSFRRPSCN